MPYLYTPHESDLSYVVEDEPENMGFFESATYFEIWRDADTAAMLLNRVKQQARIAGIPNQDDKVKELTAKLEKQAEIIRNQSTKIEALKRSVAWARECMERWFSDIARDLLLQRTHRDRNELYRGIARGMDSWCNVPHEQAGMEDIPF